MTIAELKALLDIQLKLLSEKYAEAYILEHSSGEYLAYFLDATIHELDEDIAELHSQIAAKENKFCLDVLDTSSADHLRQCHAYIITEVRKKFS